MAHADPQLTEALGTLRFVIPVKQVDQLKAKFNWDTSTLMIHLIPVFQEKALPGMSGYHVAAVGETLTGSLLVGVNIETGDVPLNETIHAEQSVIALAFAEKTNGLRALAVSAPPCGHCRQLLNDTVGARELAIYVAGQQPTTLAQLLPADFSFRDFVTPVQQIFNYSSEKTLRAGNLQWHTPLAPTFAAQTEKLKEAAIAGAQRAFAPSTAYLGGVGLLMRDGSIFVGSYIECSAFNPSIPPLQSAMVQAVAAGHSLHDIAAAVLAERSGSLHKAQPSYRHSAWHVLRSWAPSSSYALLDIV